MTTAPKIAARAVLALAAAAAGCGAKALQPDGGVGGVGGVGTISTGASGATGSAGTIGSVGSGGAIGSGGATGAGGSTDAGPGLDALLTGQRSFAVTSRLTGVDGVGLVNVPSHSFTMIVDGDHLTAIIGGTGEGRRVTLLLLASGNGFAVVSPRRFRFPAAVATR